MRIKTGHYLATHLSTPWQFIFTWPLFQRLSFPSPPLSSRRTSGQLRIKKLYQHSSRTWLLVCTARSKDNYPSLSFFLLIHLIQPPLKSTSLHLLSNQERSELKRVVYLMVTYGLSYREERSVTAYNREVLDPQLESITSFAGIQQGVAMQTAIRAMVSREVQLQMISNSAHREDGPMEELSVNTEIPEPTVVAPKPPSKTSETNETKNTSKLQVWSVYDYFRQQNPSQAPKPAAADQRTKIWFRYKEGYSNAVCRDIKVKDLL